MIVDALTDGNTVLLDGDLRPNLNHKGVVCENVNGVWSVKCVRRNQLLINAEIAGQTCLKLGFSGYMSHKVVNANENGEFTQPRQVEKEQKIASAAARQALQNYNIYSNQYRFKRFLNDSPHSQSKAGDEFMEVVSQSRGCTALYVECVPHSTIPIVDPNTDKHTPNKPNIQQLEPPTPHHADPTDTETRPKTIEKFSAPWLASVYVDGNLTCIGIFLDRHWVLVERSCVNIEE